MSGCKETWGVFPWCVPCDRIWLTGCIVHSRTERLLSLLRSCQTFALSVWLLASNQVFTTE